jgi:hypothetical protein
MRLSEHYTEAVEYAAELLATHRAAPSEAEPDLDFDACMVLCVAEGIAHAMGMFGDIEDSAINQGLVDAAYEMKIGLWCPWAEGLAS